MSAGISAARGDWSGAGLSLLAVVPLEGEGDEALKVARDAKSLDKGVADAGTASGFTKNPWSFITGAPTKALPEAKGVFTATANSDEFLLKAGITPGGVEHEDLLKALDSADFRASNALQGGFAGMEDGKIVMGISPGNLNNRFALSHELHHLVRHIRGITPFEAEEGMRGIYRYRAWAEEVKTYYRQFFGY